MCKRQKGQRERFCAGGSRFPPRPRAPRLRWLARGGAQEPPCRVSGPWDVSEKIPLAIYLNGFGLAVSWTRLARVGSSRNLNRCLEGTPSTGRKSLVNLRPSLGVKRSEKWRAHVRIFLEYFCLFFLKVLPNTEFFGPFPCGK